MDSSYTYDSRQQLQCKEQDTVYNVSVSLFNHCLLRYHLYFRYAEPFSLVTVSDKDKSEKKQ